MTQLGVIETSVIPPIVSIRVRLGGRSAPFADRHLVLFYLIKLIFLNKFIYYFSSHSLSNHAQFRPLSTLTQQN